MKQVFSILCILATGALTTQAQSMLKVSLADKTPIKVAVDGRYFNNRGQTVTVADLPSGRHYLKIFALTTSRRGTQIDEVIFEGKIKTYRGQITQFVYDRNSGMSEESDQDMDPGNMGQRPDNQGDAESFNNRNLNNYDTRDNGTNNSQQNNTTTTENTDAPPPLPAGTPLVSPETANAELDALEKEAAKDSKPVVKANQPLKDAKLEKARKKIAAKGTDTDKLETAKTIFKNEKLTTAKVMTIIGWFDFENSKVDFAKWAYTNTTDKANYKNVKTKLSMKSYREEMDKFLKNNKG